MVQVKRRHIQVVDCDNVMNVKIEHHPKMSHITDPQLVVKEEVDVPLFMNEYD